jgi:hypothetical protein
MRQAVSLCPVGALLPNAGWTADMCIECAASYRPSRLGAPGEIGGGATVSRNCELKPEGPQCGMIRGRAALRPAVPGPLELPALRLPLLRLLVAPVPLAVTAIRVAGPGPSTSLFELKAATPG